MTTTHIDSPSVPPIIDLFSGCGGMSLGLGNAGLDVIAGYDNWELAVTTYNANLDHEAHVLDLSDVDTTIAELSRHVREDGSFPAIVGGPPCQDFSAAGKQVSAGRADLTTKFSRLITHFRPPFFVMENVPRAFTATVYQESLDHMRENGYTIITKVLDSSLCGVPQKRKRLIAFGSLDSDMPERVLAWWEDNLSEKPMSMRDHFGDRLNTEHFYHTPRNYNRRAVFSVDSPSPTIRGVNRKIAPGYPGHPGDSAPIDQCRALTTPERGEVQTFPADYTWVGAKTHVEQMIGNAVPVNLGSFIGRSIIDAYSEAPGNGDT